MKLSPAMVRALRDFAEPGGHGYGEYAYLARPTAKALRDRGLVTLSTRDLGGGRKMGWGVATEAGVAILLEIRNAQ